MAVLTPPGLIVQHDEGHAYQSPPCLRLAALDQRYDTIRGPRAGDHKIVSKHGFHVVNEDTGLIQIYQSVFRGLDSLGRQA